MHSRYSVPVLVAALSLASAAAFATTPTISVARPTNNSKTTSPVHYQATASSPDCAKGISAMRIYSAPGVEANTVAGGKLDSYINLPVGTYPTVIVAYDNCGGVATADVTVTTTSETTPGGFVYTVNSNWSADNKTNTLNFVMGFTIVAGDGSLALTGQDPVKTNIDPLSVAPDYGGYRLYVGDYVSGDVVAYFVNRDNGYPTAVPGAPFPANRAVSVVAVHPSGKLIFAARDENSTSGDGVAVFELQSNGSLVQAPGSPYSTQSGPLAMVVDPTGKYLYIADASNYIDAFNIDTSNATLSPLPGSPFKISVPSDCHPHSGAFPNAIIAPAGKYLYTADSFMDSISGYSIGGSGVPTEIAGSPWPIDGGCDVPPTCQQCAFNPYSVAVDGTGKFLYAFNSDIESISIFSIAENGVLTYVKDTAQGVCCLLPIRTDSTGNYLYAGAGGYEKVPAGYVGLVGFSINHTTGDLTPLPTSPYNYPVLSTTSNGLTNYSLLSSFTVTR